MPRGRQRGAAVIEFAIAAPVVLMLLLVTFDLSLLLWAHMTLQYAVREGARYAVVDHGRIGGDPGCADVIRVIQDNSMGLTRVLNPAYEIAINNGRPRKHQIIPGQSCPFGMFGTRGDLIVLKLTAKWPMSTPFLPGVGYDFSVAATMQNEER